MFKTAPGEYTGPNGTSTLDVPLINKGYYITLHTVHTDCTYATGGASLITTTGNDSPYTWHGSSTEDDQPSSQRREYFLKPTSWGCDWLIELD